MGRHEQPPAGHRVAPFTTWTNGWGALSGAILVATALDMVKGEPNATDGLYLFVFSSGATVFGALMRRARRRAAAAQEPVTGPYHPFPPATSAAWQPMRDLGEAETALAQVVDRLRVAAVPAAVVEDAWRTATETAAELRAVATALASVELAATQAPSRERADLEGGVARLHARLDQGVAGYRGLVAAAGRALLASAPALAHDELVEATESLAGLAEALRELNPR